jgi:hypothetical protein
LNARIIYPPEGGEWKLIPLRRLNVRIRSFQQVNIAALVSLGMKALSDAKSMLRAQNQASSQKSASAAAASKTLPHMSRRPRWGTNVKELLTRNSIHVSFIEHREMGDELLFFRDELHHNVTKCGFHF